MKGLTEMFVNEAASLAEKAKKLYRDYDKIDKELDKINKESYEIINKAIEKSIDDGIGQPYHYPGYIYIPEQITVYTNQSNTPTPERINAVCLDRNNNIRVALFDEGSNIKHFYDRDEIKYYTIVVATIADQLK